MTHTTESMASAEKIAAGLSEAQRRDVAHRENERQFWSADGRTARALERKGLIEGLRHGGSADWTTLGQQVREILRRQS